MNFRCPDCGVVFLSEEELREHEKTHKGPPGPRAGERPAIEEVT